MILLGHDNDAEHRRPGHLPGARHHRRRDHLPDLGKPELCGTVILDILDADGNTEDVTYAGTTCAAKVTGSKATSIKNAAAAADYRRSRDLENARQQLSWWEPIEFDRKAILDLYFTGNPAARGLVNAPQRVAEILRDARAVIASGGRA